MPSSKWQCQYIGTDGKQCENTALIRLHFSADHPFNHVDVCPEHQEKFLFSLWEHSLSQYPEKEES